MLEMPHSTVKVDPSDRGHRTQQVIAPRYDFQDRLACGCVHCGSSRGAVWRATSGLVGLRGCEHPSSVRQCPASGLGLGHVRIHPRSVWYICCSRRPDARALAGNSGQGGKEARRQGGKGGRGEAAGRRGKGRMEGRSGRLQSGGDNRADLSTVDGGRLS